MPFESGAIHAPQHLVDLCLSYNPRDDGYIRNVFFPRKDVPHETDLIATVNKADVLRLYDLDVSGIVAAYEHGLIFTKADIDKLIATNRDYMWNKDVKGAKFQRIDGGKPDEHWKDSPGVLWSALLPYDETLRKVFEANHNPSGWGGLSATPWYLAHRDTAGR